jgi:ubiquinone/menaquinone biosynthesis C-methylase UbiE
MLGPPENGAVVDVGAGTGNYAAALAGRGYQVVAVEPSATMRDQAENVPGVRWVDAMAEQLSLPNGCAGGVVCVLALHHFLPVVCWDEIYDLGSLQIGLLDRRKYAQIRP